MDNERIGIKKIRFYEPKLYAIHYKGKPFSISNLSYDEQKQLGIRYIMLSKNSTRKVYFSEAMAKSGIHHLPKEIQAEVEIVKYIPQSECISDKNFMPLFEESEDKDDVRKLFEEN